MKSRPLSRLFLPCLFALLACTMAAGDGLAGPRDENLQDSPIAVTAVGRDELAQTRLSMDVISQLNAVRANPQAFADILRGPRPVLRGIGAGDRAEAAAFLDALDSRPPLTYSPALSDIAVFHARDIGINGLLSHTGSQGTTMGGRFRARGLTPTMTAEELSFGQRTGTDVILSLIVDAGVPGKPHRNDLFNPVFSFVGVGCAPHKTMGQVCVINLSNGFMRPPPPISLAPTPANLPLFNCPPGLLPGDPDAIRASIAGQVGDQLGSFSEADLTTLASAANFGLQHLGQTLGTNPGAYNTLGSPPWTPPQDTSLLPRWCAAWVGGMVAGDSYQSLPSASVRATIPPGPVAESDFFQAFHIGFEVLPPMAPFVSLRPDVTPYMTDTSIYLAPEPIICVAGSNYVNSFLPSGQLHFDDWGFVRIGETAFNTLDDETRPFDTGSRDTTPITWTTPYCGVSGPNFGYQPENYILPGASSGPGCVLSWFSWYDQADFVAGPREVDGCSSAFDAAPADYTPETPGQSTFDPADADYTSPEDEVPEPDPM